MVTIPVCFFPCSCFYDVYVRFVGRVKFALCVFYTPFVCRDCRTAFRWRATSSPHVSLPAHYFTPANANKRYFHRRERERKKRVVRARISALPSHRELAFLHVSSNNSGIIGQKKMGEKDSPHRLIVFYQAARPLACPLISLSAFCFVEPGSPFWDHMYIISYLFIAKQTTCQFHTEVYRRRTAMRLRTGVFQGGLRTLFALTPTLSPFLFIIIISFSLYAPRGFSPVPLHWLLKKRSIYRYVSAK